MAVTLAWSMPSAASCTNVGAIYPSTTINVPATLSVPRDKYANGAWLWQSPRLYNTVVNTIECSNPATGSDYEWGLVTAGPLASSTAYSGFPGGLPTIYNTSVPGIGIAIMFYDDAANPNGAIAKPVYTTAQKTYWNLITGSYFRNSADYQVTIIKTGNVSPGVLKLAGTVAQVWYGGGDAPNAPGSVLSAQMYFSNDITITAPSCTISNPNVTVTMPKVSMNALPAADTAAGATPFTISMLCNNTKVSYQIDANQYSSGYNSLIVPTGTAKGVAVQLLNRSTTPWSGMPLGTKTLLGDSTGSSNVAMNIPLAARYYRPNGAPALQAGTVTAAATLTMFYE